MFCHKCGYKLTNNKQCSNCGTILEKFEVCGGFWGLVGEERKEPCGMPKEPFVVNDKELLENLAILTEKVEKAERRQQMITYATYGLLAIVIVILIFSNVVLLSKLDELKDFNKKYFKNLENVLVTESVSEEMTTVTEKHTVQETTTTEPITTEDATTESETTVSEETITETSSAESEPTLEPTTTETITLETQTIS